MFSLWPLSALMILLVNLTNIFHFQALTHLHVVTVLMTFIMVVAILTSIAIVRRILMATSVLKASINWSYSFMNYDKVFFCSCYIFDTNYVYFLPQKYVWGWISNQGSLSNIWMSFAMQCCLRWTLVTKLVNVNKLA